MSLSSVERRILERIKPREYEYRIVFNAYNRIKNVIEQILKKHNVKAEVTLQGSIAHDTWLSGDRDLDIFVLFPLEWSVEELKTKGFKILVEAAETIGNYSIRYAEHPYVRVKLGDVEADLVPAFNVRSSEDVRTAVDRTPLHTRYLLERLTPELRDHVRLLKRFMKGIGVYGAEIKTRGFSGYFVELLVLTYGGFREVIGEASRWRHPVYINTLGDKDRWVLARKVLRRRYPDSVVYAPDPVDHKRNVAASVSLKSLVLFSTASKCYIKNPSETFFFPLKISLEETISRGNLENRCILLIFISFNENLPPETIWGELRRVMDRTVKVLVNNDFKPLDWSCWSNEYDVGVVALEVEECRRPMLRIYNGPEYYHGERVLSFIRRHIERRGIGPWIREDSILASLSKRKYVDVRKLLMDRSWEYMVTPHTRDKKPVIKTIDEVLEELDRVRRYSRGFREWIAKFIVKREPWMESCIF